MIEKPFSRLGSRVYKLHITHMNCANDPHRGAGRENKKKDIFPRYFPVKQGFLFSAKAVNASVRSSEGIILELIAAT